MLTLLRATRPHFFALPIGATLAGIAATGEATDWRTLLLVSLVAGAGWGVGQLLNDVLDREADAVDAPLRPAVQGLLPSKPTLGFALVLGLVLVALLTRLTPHWLALSASAALLIVCYNPCKAWPAFGNIAHGLLIACAALIGASVAKPEASLAALIHDHILLFLLVFFWAALYLQANYEKDAQGDAAAGYRTLAHVLGIRASASIRAISAVVAGLLIFFHLGRTFFFVPSALCAVLLATSAVHVAHLGTPQAALGAYRASVHAGTLGMITLGGPALGIGGLAGALIGAALLTEWAFQKSPNP